MRPYADLPGRRTAQIIADVVAIALIVASVWLGLFVRDLVAALAGLGQQIEDAGAGFRGTMEEIGDTLGGVPLIGGGIREPFENAGAAGSTLEAVGRGQQQFVENIAAALGVAVAAGPIAIVLLVWLVPRLVSIVRAGQVRAALATPDGADLLALRALVRRSPREVLGVESDPLTAWRARDERVIAALAALEAGAVGVRIDRARVSP